VASVIETEFAGQIEAFTSDFERMKQEGVAAEVAKAQPELVALREAVGKFQEQLDQARKDGASEMLQILKSRLGMF
jgi:hypothetical protein